MVIPLPNRKRSHGPIKPENIDDYPLPCRETIENIFAQKSSLGEYEYMDMLVFRCVEDTNPKPQNRPIAIGKNSNLEPSPTKNKWL